VPAEYLAALTVKAPPILRTQCINAGGLNRLKALLEARARGRGGAKLRYEGRVGMNQRLIRVKDGMRGGDCTQHLHQRRIES
jgi:hypothetical protein